MRGGLWGEADFRRLWVGQTVSELGSVVTRTAIPIAAVVTLGASAAEMGLLVAAASSGVLIVGLFAGVWTDRLRKRPIMIASDLTRAAVLATVPAAAVAGALSMPQLYLVAFFEAVLGAFFDVAYRSYLPSLVRADQLMEGNSKLSASSAVAELGGPSLGGALVQLITAPLAILVDALSFLASAVSLALIRQPEPRPPGRANAAGVWAEIREGLLVVWREPLLRAPALAYLTSALFGNFFAALYTLYALEDLGLSPLLLGIVISAGGVGALAAAVLAPAIERRAGVGPTIVWTRLGGAMLSLLIPLAGGPPLVAALFLFIPQLIGDGLLTVGIISTITLRQRVAPPLALGRVTATMTVLLEGVAPIGAIAGAAIAELHGVRAAVSVAVLGGLAATGFLFASPLPRLRRLSPGP